MKRLRPGVNRRDLLRLRRLSGDSPGGADHRDPSPERADLVRAHRPAMGSFFEVRLPAAMPGAVSLACRALDLIEELEAQLTVYRDDSEVSELNRTAHLAPVRVERRLFALLESAVAISRETGGAYDVTSGALSEAWGFVKGPKRVPDEATLAGARACTGWQHLRLDRESMTVGFDREGIRINLGSIGKGYAIDRAIELIRSNSLYRFGPGARRPFEPVCPGLAAGPVRRPLGNRAAQSIRAGIAPGHAAAAEPWPGDLGVGLPAVRRRRQGLRPHHRPADRRARHMGRPASRFWPPRRPSPTPFPRPFICWDRRPPNLHGRSS